MIADLLAIAARHARAFLVAGLVAGIFLPDLAAILRPWLPEMVAFLLFLTAFRIGPRDAIHSLAALRRTAGTVLILQLGLPLAAIAALSLAGVQASPLAFAVVLMLAAPSITGAANFTLMTGNDPAPSLRLLVVGTALLPLTVLPVLATLPALGDPAAVLAAAARLLAVILGATAAAFVLRHVAVPGLTLRAVRALDGITALALAVIVVALMSAIAPTWERNPTGLLGWLAAAFAVNFGLQLATFGLLRRTGSRADTVPVAITAGNRNIALFLVALPASTTDPLLVFIGCYQIPMYLTPILLGRLYARRAVPG